MEQRVLTPNLQLPGGATPNVLIFVPMTPCRLADTRTTSTPSYPALGLTPLATLTPRTLPVAGSCEVEKVGFLFPGPEAYSLNVTVVPPAGTHGGYLLVYPNPATPIPLVASMTWNPNASYQTGAVVAAASSDGSVNIVANSATDVVVDINGYYAAPTGPQGDTALGIGALAGNTAGADNTAFGYLALANNASGAFNAAFGALALGSNTSGLDNTAVGYAALSASAGGTDNTAVGYQAMKSMNGNVPASGSQNTALGSLALQANVSGVGNTALGAGALQHGTGIYNTVIGLQAGTSLTTGSHNILVGEEAGINVVAGNDNIQIGNGVGLVGDDSTIRIGGQDVQTSTYIAGIAGNILSSGSPVVVNVLGQLGVEGVSSRRYKEDIQDMGEASDGLLRLRPVTFRYKKPAPDGPKPLEFGLVAEEVADVYPELVIRGADGQIESVQYQKLPAMLLNELQKEHRNAEQLARRAEQQDETIRKLEARLGALEAQLANATAALPTPGR
jgi:hypothetical protein